MKKFVILIAMLILVASSTSVAYAGTNSPVEYTASVDDLGQGVWGGAPLYADGTAGGYLSFSAADGQMIFQLYPTSWEEVYSGAYINVCFNVREIKGSSGFPPSFCLSDIGFLLPVTGTPIVISDPDSGFQTLIRVTPVN